MKKLAIALASTLLITSAYAKSPVPASASASASASTKASVAESNADPMRPNSKRDAINAKHIKDLHDKLKITAAEETLWSTVAQTMRDNVTEIDKAVDKRESLIGTASAIDDLNAYANVAQAHADSVKKLALVFAPLYAAMSDAQKKLADEVFLQRGHHNMMSKGK